MTVPDDGVVIRALRRHQSETEITQVIGALCAAEKRFATDFVRLVLAETGRVPDIEALAEMSSCVVEETHDGDRLDLSLRGSDWWVIVELKIRAALTDHQVERYLRVLKTGTKRYRYRYFVAITRDVPAFTTPPARDQFAGAIQWSGILEGLRRLEPAVPHVARDWQVFLNVLEEEGSMGFTKPDPTLFSAWGSVVQTTKHMELFVDTARLSILGAFKHATGREAAFVRAGKEIFSYPRAGRVESRLRFDADSLVRARFGVVGSEVTSFFLDIGPIAGGDRADEATRDAANRLEQAGFKRHGRNRLYYGKRLALDAAQLASENLVKDCAEWAEVIFRRAADTGIFDVAGTVDDEETDDDIAG